MADVRDAGRPVIAVRGRRARVLAVLVLALVLVPLLGMPPARATGEHRILITGDSITQGSSGDYTWRYRLWQKLASTEPGRVSFVGPRTDLYDVVRRRQGSSSYAAPFSARAHGAVWGDTYAAELPQVASVVRRSGADVLVSMLGSNDLRSSSAETVTRTIARVRSYVERARAVRPGLDVVLGEPLSSYDAWSHRSLMTVRVGDFAHRLQALADSLDTPDERVVVAHTRTGWDPARLTWDGTHPNPSGEALIAQRTSEALARIGVGSSGPDVAGRRSWSVRGPRVRLVPGSERIRVSWDRAPSGATGMYVEQRLVDAHEAWRRLPYAVAGDGWTSTGLVAGGTYDLRVVPVKGSAVGLAGPARRVRVGGPVPGRIGRVRAVLGGSSRFGGMSALGLWSAAPRATGYLISDGLVSDRTTRWHDYPYPTTTRDWLFEPLQAGRRYVLRVRGARGYLRGRWRPSRVTRVQGRPLGFVQVALGDSYSSGLGSRAATYSGRGCLRSAGSWVFQLDSWHRRAIAHLACAGARVPGVRKQLPAMNRFFREFRGQPQLVTVTVGGNDVGFADELARCVKRDCTRDEAGVRRKIDQLGRTLREFYSEIRRARPTADVIAGGYPAVLQLGGTTGNLVCGAFAVREYQMVDRLAARLNARIALEAKRAGIWSVGQRVRAAFQGHNACAGGPGEWINPLVIGHGGSGLPVSPLSFHPNDKGQAAYARVFNETLDGHAR